MVRVGAGNRFGLALAAGTLSRRRSGGGWRVGGQVSRVTLPCPKTTSYDCGLDEAGLPPPTLPRPKTCSYERGAARASRGRRGR